MPMSKTKYHESGLVWLAKAKAATDEKAWKELWKDREDQFPLQFGDCWRQTLEYQVADFPAEVGFFLDALGLSVNAFASDYAMFTDPKGSFYFSIVPARDGKSTPPDSIKLEFMVSDIHLTVKDLEKRGITFESHPRQAFTGSNLIHAHFRTPHGIKVELWSVAPAG